MYGCFDGVIVYGWNQGDRDILLKFEDLQSYALDVVRNNLGEAYYGIICGLDINTGHVEISTEEKEKVKKIYNKHKSEDSTLGFRVCVYGNYDVSHDEISEEENNSEKESEEESESESEEESEKEKES